MPRVRTAGCASKGCSRIRVLASGPAVTMRRCCGSAHPSSSPHRHAQHEQLAQRLSQLYCTVLHLQAAAKDTVSPSCLSVGGTWARAHSPAEIVTCRRSHTWYHPDSSIVFGHTNQPRRSGSRNTSSCALWRDASCAQPRSGHARTPLARGEHTACLTASATLRRGGWVVLEQASSIPRLCQP